MVMIMIIAIMVMMVMNMIIAIISITSLTDELVSDLWGVGALSEEDISQFSQPICFNSFSKSPFSQIWKTRWYF